MSQIRQIAIVCNPQAGKGKSLRLSRQIQQQLQTRQIAHTIFSDTWPVNFDGFTDVFIAGGDGTLNYFINRYPNISIPYQFLKEVPETILPGNCMETTVLKNILTVHSTASQS